MFRIRLKFNLHAQLSGLFATVRSLHVPSIESETLAVWTGCAGLNVVDYVGLGYEVCREIPHADTHKKDEYHLLQRFNG